MFGDFLIAAVFEEGVPCDGHRNWPLAGHGPHEGHGIILHLYDSFHCGPHRRAVKLAKGHLNKEINARY